jgi:protocatechuate 3,4-dioxygenase beta subunit
MAGAGGGPTVTAGTGGMNSGIAGPGVMWATGGTKSMQGGYPDPFAMGTMGMMGTACRVYPTQQLGPCYADGPMMRDDISDGMPGLPMRLSFLVVRASGCMPVPDAQIDIWHSGFDGVYSDYATGTICNPGMMTTQNMMFCRGVQMTNMMGRADFNTIFPGWYRGRTIHIHFTVRVGGRATITSQLYFEDAMTDEILAQGEYKPRGTRDTKNSGDNTFKSGGATPEQVLFQSAKRPDGALHAWKVLSIA